MSKDYKSSKVTIKIPRPLYNKLKEIIDDTGFSSVTEFAVWVLRDIAAGGALEAEKGLSAEEVNLIRKRLKNLGYL